MFAARMELLLIVSEMLYWRVHFSLIIWFMNFIDKDTVAIFYTVV